MAGPHKFAFADIRPRSALAGISGEPGLTSGTAGATIELTTATAPPATDAAPADSEPTVDPKDIWIHCDRFPHIVDNVLHLLLADGQGLATRAISKTWRKISDAHLCRKATLTPLYERGVPAETLIAPITGAHGLEVGVLRVAGLIRPDDEFGAIRVVTLPLPGPCRLPLVKVLTMKALVGSEWVPKVIDAFPDLDTARITGRIMHTFSLSLPVSRLILDGTPLLRPSVEEVGPRVTTLVINIRGKERHPLLPDGTLRAPPAAVDHLVLLLHPKCPRDWSQTNGWPEDEGWLLADGDVAHAAPVAALAHAWAHHNGHHVGHLPAAFNPLALANGNGIGDNEPADRWPRTVLLAVATLKAGGRVTIVNADYDSYRAYFNGERAAPVTGSGLHRSMSTSDLAGSSSDYSALTTGMSHLALSSPHHNTQSSQNSRPRVSLEESINVQAIERSSTSVIGELRSISIDEYCREIGVEELKCESYFD